MSAASSTAPGVAVIKMGGSVLTGPAACERAASYIAHRVADEAGARFVVVVSAEQGVTDALLELARGLNDPPNPAMRDLLWSTGELRSVALLALALQARGVRATGVNVQQTGLLGEGLEDDTSGPRGRLLVRPLRLHALLASHDVIVAPGFLARGDGDRVVSLGRGGSDLTAVVLAAALGAERCELVKDVPGYFSSDPHHDPDARHLAALDYAAALAMAAGGCEVVQPAALAAAERHALTIVVRSIDNNRRTEIRPGPAYQRRRAQSASGCHEDSIR